MSQKRQSPGKRANAARAQNQSIRTRKATTALGVFSRSARVAGAAVQHDLLQVKHVQALPSLLETPYSLHVAAKSVTDLGRSRNERRTGAHHQIAGAFLCLQLRVMAAVRGTPSGVPGPFRPGRPTRVQLPPSLAWPRAVAAPQRKELHP